MKKVLITTFAGLLTFIVLSVFIFEFNLGSPLHKFILGIKDHDGLITRIQLLNLLFMCLFILLSTVIGYFLAKKKGKSRFLWPILCFFFNIWALIILWLLPSSKK
jgi:hypothetical protein